MGSAMKKFKINYRTIEGDISQAYVEAGNVEDAKVQLRREYWDVYEIINVYCE